MCCRAARAVTDNNSSQVYKGEGKAADLNDKSSGEGERTRQSDSGANYGDIREDWELTNELRATRKRGNRGILRDEPIPRRMSEMSDRVIVKL